MNRIAKIEHRSPHKALVTTDDGGRYFVRPPVAVGDDVFQFKFERAQPMIFTQNAGTFYRYVEGQFIPFFSYIPRHLPQTDSLQHLEQECRNRFISDLAVQNVVPTFTGDRK